MLGIHAAYKIRLIASPARSPQQVTPFFDAFLPPACLAAFTPFQLHLVLYCVSNLSSLSRASGEDKVSDATLLAVVTIGAILFGPVAALQVQKWLEDHREKQGRKLWVFKTLMMYRATTLSPLFVQALNVIDVEFDSKKKKEAEVREAWKVLLDHFSSPPIDGKRTSELTARLLLVMGKCLGYHFDEVYIKKGAYYPTGLVDVEQEQHALRRKVLDLLAGKNRLPIAIFEEKFPQLFKPDDDEGPK